MALNECRINDFLGTMLNGSLRGGHSKVLGDTDGTANVYLVANTRGHCARSITNTELVTCPGDVARPSGAFNAVAIVG